MSMTSKHRILFCNAQKLENVDNESVNLMVTSPPYPMIEMWDECFSMQNPEIRSALQDNDGNTAFKLMHEVLDSVWGEIYRVIKPGGFACINIGDATRTVDSHFRLYANHARILTRCLNLGFSNLPAVIWRKQTNAPNKFMGSGMLPAGAYVTLEHEYVLILRKGNKREFKTPAEKLSRSQSAFFWEERNTWFSDVWWDLKGVGQNLNHDDIRKRSGAFPFELAYRLINMYSAKGDTVLDPFVGTGTTSLASIASNRNSIGVEIDPNFKNVIFDSITKNVAEKCNNIIKQRLSNHIKFVEDRMKLKGEKTPFRYTNKSYGFPVMTNQEVNLLLDYIERVKKEEDCVSVTYSDKAVLDYAELQSLFA